MEGRIEKKKRRVKRGVVKEDSESWWPLETYTGPTRKNNTDKSTLGSNTGIVKNNRYVSILPDGFWAAVLTAHHIKSTNDNALKLH